MLAAMSVALQQTWTAEHFLTWAAAQEGRYEFDGVRPVGMTGGNADHNRVMINIHAALRSRLRGTPCAVFGPDLGVQAGAAIRYPDALVTCTKFPGTERLAPDVCIVFEALSPSTASNDRISKVRDYALVPSIRSYVMVETRFAGVMVLHREPDAAAWTATALTLADVLALPEIGVEIPVAELYEDVAFSPEPESAP